MLYIDPILETNLFYVRGIIMKHLEFSNNPLVASRNIAGETFLEILSTQEKVMYRSGIQHRAYLTPG
ncbi:hypothetical protein EmuJ_000135800 [Echinococcus multilocularis]|uniref:Uncharacterized protein n=1 Tax=Echinococcus multilocularis TaxID=6211 RepID=A0A087VZ09_ECHMU|nr:hypothetical protein EmuJ_000135800 [Echinococcus multilocularis]